MKREQKESVVLSLKDRVLASEGTFVVQYQGLTVVQLQNLRKELRSHGGSFQVAKARLMKRAVDGAEGAQDLTPHLKGQIGLVFAQQNSPAVVKALFSYAKENEALQVLLGCFESKMLSKEEVSFIASIPSRDVLIAQVLGLMQAPPTRLVGTLNALLVKLVLLVKAIAEQKQGQA